MFSKHLSYNLAEDFQLLLVGPSGLCCFLVFCCLSSGYRLQLVVASSSFVFFNRAD